MDTFMNAEKFFGAVAFLKAADMSREIDSRMVLDLLRFSMDVTGVSCNRDPTRTNIAQEHSKMQKSP